MGSDAYGGFGWDGRGIDTWLDCLLASGQGINKRVTVSRHVARRRTELGLDRVDVAVPQKHLPGAEAEVDFGEFHAVIAGTLLKLWMFVLRLSYSGRAFHAAFATQAQEAFLEGHVLAFEHFGAVPGRIRHENVPRNIFRLLCPAALCGGGSAAPEATVVDESAPSFLAT